MEKSRNDHVLSTHLLDVPIGTSSIINSLIFHLSIFLVFFLNVFPQSFPPFNFFFN